MILPSILDAALLNKVWDLNTIISKLDEWSKLKVHGVCVPSSYVNIDKIHNKLIDMHWQDINVIPVIGYPNGDTSIVSKISEIVDNYNFATYLDIVLNPVFIRIGAWDLVRREIIEILMHTPCDVRWIIETPILHPHEIIEVCKIILDHSGQIKTATGVRGSTKVEDVLLIKSIVGTERIIKAAGGIKDADIANKMIEAGASIIGTSSPETLITK